MQETFRIILTDEIKEKCTVLEAFPGIGLVGGIAANFMIEKLKMRYVGYVESKFLPPVAILKDGLVYPPAKIYSYRDILILQSDVPIYPQIIHEISKSIVDWSSENNADKIISLAGVALPFSGSRVYGAANADGLIKLLKSNGVEILNEGAIGGVSGQILLDAITAKIPAFSLLAETKGMNPDPRASAEILKVLGKILNFDIDVTTLIEEAENIEAQMEELARQTREIKRKEIKELPMFY